MRYEQLKVEFQGWTLGIGLVGGIGCCYLYGTDVAISFALGASSGLQYLRLLSRSVDSGKQDTHAVPEEYNWDAKLASSCRHVQHAFWWMGYQMGQRAHQPAIHGCARLTSAHLARSI